MQTFTNKQRWLYAILWPICALVLLYFLVLLTAEGAGSSIGFRAIGAMIAFPAVLLLTFLVNLALVLPFAKSRVSAFWFGMITPGLSVIIEYIYLWQTFREYPDIG